MALSMLYLFANMFNFFTADHSHRLDGRTISVVIAEDRRGGGGGGGG